MGMFLCVCQASISHCDIQIMYNLSMQWILNLIDLIGNQEEKLGQQCLRAIVEFPVHVLVQSPP